ncbi:MAG: DsbA family oxidoreductase [Candidatus Nanopelagicales bacterium]
MSAAGISRRGTLLSPFVMVEIWSDVVCPWCYIGTANLSKALEGFPGDVDVVYRSFQLDPGAPEEPRSQIDYLGERYGGGREQALAMARQVTQVAARAGLDFHLEDTQAGQTLDAHRLLHLAADRGVQGALAERMFAAHFTEQRSIFDHASLLALAVEAGLEPSEVTEVLASDRYLDAVRSDIEQAQAFGATGVPFFVVDRTYAVSGAQPPEVLLEVLERVRAGQ